MYRLATVNLAVADVFDRFFRMIVRFSIRTR